MNVLGFSISENCFSFMSKALALVIKKSLSREYQSKYHRRPEGAGSTPVFASKLTYISHGELVKRVTTSGLNNVRISCFNGTSQNQDFILGYCGYCLGALSSVVRASAILNRGSVVRIHQRPHTKAYENWYIGLIYQELGGKNDPS